MVFIYVENKPNFFSLSRRKPLPALESQVLEIYDEFNFMEESILGLVIENKTEIRIKSYNKYIWEVYIKPLNADSMHYKCLYYSKTRVEQLIRDVFSGKELI